MKMPRNPTDLCLLCRSREAKKLNSHLVPGFLSTEMFLDASKKHFLMFKPEKKIFRKPSQSTVKEDYIMCPECEARLGLLERYMANNFFKFYKNQSHALQFPRSMEITPPRRELINMPYVDSNIFNLFSYSIFWRVANSVEHYPNYNLPESINEELRRELDVHISYKWDKLVIQAEGFTLQDKYPYDIHTCLTNKQQGINWVIARDYHHDRSSFIAANEFHFHFYDSKNSFNTMHQFSSDLNSSHIKVVPFADWHSMLQHIQNSVFFNFNK